MSVLLCCFLGLFAIRWQGTGFGKLPHFTSASFFFPIFRQFLCLFFSFWLLIFKCSKSNLHFWRFYFALSFLFNCLYFLRVHVDLLALQTPRCDPRATMWHTPSMLGPACPQHGHPECPVKAPFPSLFPRDWFVFVANHSPPPQSATVSVCVLLHFSEAGFRGRNTSLSCLPSGMQAASWPVCRRNGSNRPARGGGVPAGGGLFPMGSPGRPPPSGAFGRRPRADLRAELLRRGHPHGQPSPAGGAPSPTPPAQGPLFRPRPPPPPNGRAMGRWCRRAGY